MLDDNSATTIESVKEYYGEVLSSSKDLKTSACCTADALPTHVKEALALVADEVQERFYGCGSPIPDGIEGCTVLDLGCGTGRDCYVLSKLVGEKGRVIGVDMTDEQLGVANQYVDYHTEKFGYSAPNVEFRQGYIEDLEGVGIADNSVDVVVSNCVINLSPQKSQVFREIFRVLKPGGQLYFSDVFSASRIPEELQKDPVLHGECLSGALYTEDFRRVLEEVGCPDHRLISSRVIEINNAELEKRIGMITFYSQTISAFKLDSLEDRCEDYGQVATYLGTLPNAPFKFALDDHHIFVTGKPMLVCGNTAAMVQETRYSSHFKVTGDRSAHFGLFDCSDPGSNADDCADGACC